MFDRSDGQDRIQYIDGLRALAVLSVVIYHAAGRFAASLPGWLHYAVLQGSHGVDLFFVISGFCLAYPTLAKRESGSASAFAIDRFLSKRFVRIIPPFYGAILVVALAYSIVRASGHAVPASLYDVSGIRAFLPQFVFFEGFGYSNPSFWSLFVEFRWYFVFPLVLLAWCRAPRAFAAIAIVAVALYATGVTHFIDVLTLPSFMLGIVAAQLASTRHPFARVAPAGLLVLGILGAIYPPNPTMRFENEYWVGWPLASFFLIASVGAWAPLARVFSWRPLTAVGFASYSIYLVHEPCVAILEETFGVAWPLAAVVAVAFGFAFWFLIERIFETGSVKSACVARLTPLVTRVLRFVRIPTAFTVANRPSAPAAPSPLGVESRSVPS